MRLNIARFPKLTLKNCNYNYVTVLAETNLAEQFVIFHNRTFYR